MVALPLLGYVTGTAPARDDDNDNDGNQVVMEEEHDNNNKDEIDNDDDDRYAVRKITSRHQVSYFITSSCLGLDLISSAP